MWIVPGHGVSQPHVLRRSLQECRGVGRFRLEPFFEAHLDRYLELVQYKISEPERNSLFNILRRVQPGKWEAIYSVPDHVERRQLINKSVLLKIEQRK